MSNEVLFSTTIDYAHKELNDRNVTGFLLLVFRSGRLNITGSCSDLEMSHAEKAIAQRLIEKFGLANKSNQTNKV